MGVRKAYFLFRCLLFYFSTYFSSLDSISTFAFTRLEIKSMVIKGVIGIFSAETSPMLLFVMLFFSQYERAKQGECERDGAQCFTIDAHLALNIDQMNLKFKVRQT